MPLCVLIIMPIQYYLTIVSGLTNVFRLQNLFIRSENIILETFEQSLLRHAIHSSTWNTAHHVDIILEG
jgi:hypothetical protein